MQLAAATAVKGTNRPIRGGNFYNQETFMIKLQNIKFFLHINLLDEDRYSLMSVFALIILLAGKVFLINICMSLQ